MPAFNIPRTLPELGGNLDASRVNGLPTPGGIAISDANGVLIQDANFTRVGGVNVIKTPNFDGRVRQIHNVSPGRATLMPWTETYTGELAGSTVDHIYTRGWHPLYVAAGYPGLTENWENNYEPGDLNGFPTLEMHINYTSIDGLVAYRIYNGAVYMDEHAFDQLWRTRQVTWYGRNGTIPLLMIQTANGDGGTVTIANNGSANPLRVDSSGSGLVLINTGSTGGIALNNSLPSNATTTVRSSPGFGFGGSYWNGTASASKGGLFQYVIDSPTYAYLRMDVGSSAGRRHYLDDAGKAGFGLTDKVYLTQNMVIPFGAYGMVRQDQSATQALLGLDGLNVKLSPDGWRINLGADFFCQGGGLFGSNGTKRDMLDVRGTAWFGNPGSTHAIVNSADGTHINVNANGTGSNAFEVASGRSTTSGGTLGLRVESDGGVKAPVKLSVGGGQANTGNLSATATLAFSSVDAQGQQELTVTVTGAAVGDVVNLGPPSGLESGLLPTGRVTAANTVTVRVLNATASPIAPASATYRIEVRKY